MELCYIVITSPSLWCLKFFPSLLRHLHGFLCLYPYVDVGLRPSLVALPPSWIWTAMIFWSLVLIFAILNWFVRPALNLYDFGFNLDFQPSWLCWGPSCSWFCHHRILFQRLIFSSRLCILVLMQTPWFCLVNSLMQVWLFLSFSRHRSPWLSSRKEDKNMITSNKILPPNSDCPTFVFLLNLWRHLWYSMHGSWSMVWLTRVNSNFLFHSEPTNVFFPFKALRILTNLPNQPLITP